MPTAKPVRSTPALFAAGALIAAVAGCSNAVPEQPGKGIKRLGEIGVSLQIGTGIVIDEVQWTLSNAMPPTGFVSPRLGAFDVSGPATPFVGLIPDVQSGTGYDLTFTATSTDERWVCAGHAVPAELAVFANKTTLASVHLHCQDTLMRPGDVIVGGEFNVCPNVEDLTTTPFSAPVGSSIALQGLAGDPDMAPHALSYSIVLSATQPSGAGSATLEDVDPATGTASLRCDVFGPVSISMTVSDGDPTCPVESVQAFVQCTDACRNKVCAPPDQCHVAGVCDHATGVCSYADADDGTTCDDGDSDTRGDVCSDGECAGYECVSASDCPGTDEECRFRSCDDGTCGFATPEGTPSSMQVAGDCDEVRCDGDGGHVSIADDTDVPDDDNQCTNDLCEMGAPSLANAAYGTACSQDGGQICNGNGACIEPTFRVVRVGTGAGTLDADAFATFVDEYTQAGEFVGSVALPTEVSGSNRVLMLAGNDPSQGGLSLSADGHYLVLAGYDAVAGSIPAGGLNASTAASVNRTVARIGANGAVDTTTRLDAAFNTAAVRGAATDDASGFWVAGAGAGSTGGVWYVFLGDTGGTQLNSSISIRWLNVSSGRLYGDSNAGPNLFAIGSGLPASGAQALTSLPANYPNSASGQSPYGFVLLNLNPNVAGADTLYVADDTTGGIEKWTLSSSGTWNLSTTSFTEVATGTSPAHFRGLTAIPSGSTVTLIAGTAVTTGSDRIVRFVDDGSDNPEGTVIVTAGANRTFRGIAMSPH